MGRSLVFGVLTAVAALASLDGYNFSRISVSMGVFYSIEYVLPRHVKGGMEFNGVVEFGTWVPVKLGLKSSRGRRDDAIPCFLYRYISSKILRNNNNNNLPEWN